LFFLCALATAAAWSEPTDPARASASARRSTDTYSWRFGLEAGAAWAPSYAETTTLLSAGGFGFNAYVDLSLGNWIPFHGDIGLFSVSPTEWDEDLFRFRAFWGSRFGVETGYRFPIGASELSILAGGALSASRFTSLSVVTAYISILGEVRFLTPVAISGLPGLRLGASIPLEYMWRGTARTLSAGLEMCASIPFGRKSK